MLRDLGGVGRNDRDLRNLRGDRDNRVLLRRGRSADRVGRVLGSGSGRGSRSELRVGWDRVLLSTVSVLGDGGSGSGERESSNGVTHFG